jgi:hypothetical protein
MTRKLDKIRNVDACLRQRLFNISKKQGPDFQSVLKLYFLERFLYRLSISRYRNTRDGAPERFEDAMTHVIALVGPPYLDASAGRTFVGRWDPARREWRR